MTVQEAKRRFGIIGNSPLLNRAIETAIQVSPTDLSVLVTGESGTGKEAMPKIIHANSLRKHNKYIAVNCGAIPEGTIDSELFGHEKGAFTGAQTGRSGYFEEASGGTIFLDEVAELPLQTQVRLLRVLETGEFIRVGSSKVHKTDVRIVAATNVNLDDLINKGKFREDLFYRLSTVPIKLPALRERREDIHLLFRKFSSDFAEKYRMPPIRLTDEAVQSLTNYYWRGNIRQLKNITEQISVIEEERLVTLETLLRYLPDIQNKNLPALLRDEAPADFTEREILYKVLFEMRQDVNDLKKLVLDRMPDEDVAFNDSESKSQIVRRLVANIDSDRDRDAERPVEITNKEARAATPVDRTIEDHEEVEESLSLEEKEKELISKALEKYNGKRKMAAHELGISERTLYRKIKDYNLK